MKNFKKLLIIPICLLGSLASCAKNDSNECTNECEECKSENPSGNQQDNSISCQTPVEGKKARNIANYIDVSKLKLGVLFDNLTIQDINGATTSVTYPQAQIFRQGYRSHGYNFYYTNTVVTCNDLSLGGGSFTFATWFNTYDLTANSEQNVIFSNKVYNATTDTGVNVCIDSANKLSASITSGGDELSVSINPDSTFFGDHWTHFMLVYNKEEKVCDAYFNFNKINTLAIPNKHFEEEATLDSGSRYMLGIDGAKTAGTLYNGVLDDILVFDHAVNSNTIGKLKQYYLD